MRARIGALAVRGLLQPVASHTAHRHDGIEHGVWGR